MALLTRGDLVKLLGLSHAYISVSIKDGRLIPTDDGKYIDDSVPLNELFIQKRKNKPVRKQIRKNSPKATKTITKKKTNVSTPIKTTLPENTTSGYNLDNRKKEAEIRFKESQIQLAELKASKLRGESIPTELVYNVISTLGQSFITNYKNGVSELLIQISHRVKMAPEIEAEFKGKINQIINKNHKDSIDEAKNKILAIISNITNEILDEDDQEEN